MSEFLQQNKRKGLLALVLVALKKGKGLAPIALMGGLLSFIFIVPSDMRPDFSRLFRMADPEEGGFGFGPNPTGKFRDFQEALRTAKDKKGLLSTGMLPGGIGMTYYGKSTVNYVKAEDSKSKKRRELYDGLSGAKTVDGVLRPEDAEKIQEGVALKEEEFREGLLKNAFAGGFVGAPSLSGQAPFTSYALRAKASDRADDLVQASLKGSEVPFKGVLSFKGGDRRKLDFRSFNSVSGRAASAVTGITQCQGRACPFYNLIESRAYSALAAPTPDGYCDSSKCPQEFAKNTGGSVFDGGKIGGTTLNSEQFGDPAVPMTPGMNAVQPLIDKAKQLEADAKKCEAARAKYAPLEKAKMAEIQGKSKQMEDLGCSAVGCNRGKARQCKRIGDSMKQPCAELNQIYKDHANECPFMKNSYSEVNCRT